MLIYLICFSVSYLNHQVETTGLYWVKMGSKFNMMIFLNRDLGHFQSRSIMRLIDQPAERCNCHSATVKHSSIERRCPVNLNYKLKVKVFSLYPFTNQHRSQRSFTDHRAKAKLCNSTSHLTAYVMRSGLRALIMHSLCSEVLFFHSCGNFSFSGHSDSTNFFQRLAEPSMSRSRFLNSSMEDRDWW